VWLAWLRLPCVLSGRQQRHPVIVVAAAKLPGYGRSDITVNI
jgi:hypothetical protein